MGAGGLQFPGQVDIIFQRIFRPVGIVNIAGIAERGLQDPACLQNPVHGDAHVFDPVQRIEHAKDIDAAGGTLVDELFDHIVGIIGVADAVRGPQQHLGQEIGHAGAQVAQALPWAFLQETIGDIEGCSAPALHREQCRKVIRIGVSDIQHVDGAHAGRQQTLMAVAHGRVGDQQPLLLQHPVGDGLGTFAIEQVFCPLGRRIRPQRGCLGRPHTHRLSAPGGFRIAVDGDVGNVCQQPGRAVATFVEIEQVRRRVDEFGVVGVVEKGLVAQQIFDERDVG